MSQVTPVDLPVDLPVVAGGDCTAPAVDFETVTQLRGRVASRLSADGVAFEQLDPVSARMRTRALVGEELDSWVCYLVNRGLPAPSIQVEDDLVEAVMAALGGLGRLEPLLARLDVEDIFFTGCEPTMLRLDDGSKAPGPPIGDTDEEVTQLVQALGTSLGDGTSREFSAARPLLSLRLKAVGELGARLSAAMDVTHRPSGTIRVHRHVEANLDMLYELNMIDAPLRAFLRAAVLAGAKIFVAGGTGMGKTMMLRALCAEIPTDQMIVTIEDERELGLHVLAARDGQGQVILDERGRPVLARPAALVRAYEAREPNSEGVGAITMGDLTRQSLRDSPDVVVIGETRGPEMVHILDALTNGISGVMCTIHADTPTGVFSRVVQMVRQASPALPADYALSAICSLDLIVQVRRNRKHERFVSEVAALQGTIGENAMPVLETLFGPRQDGRAVSKRANVGPRLMGRLAEVGFEAAWMDPAASDWDRDRQPWRS
jgi:Flp pilus assembly CpaF family ATPase